MDGRHEKSTDPTTHEKSGTVVAARSGHHGERKTNDMLSLHQKRLSSKRLLSYHITGENTVCTTAEKKNKVFVFTDGTRNLATCKKKASNKQKQLKKTGTNKQKRLKKTEAKKKKTLEKSVDKNSEKNEKNPEESEPTATKDGESEHDGETTEEEDSGAPHHTGTSSATTPPTTPVKDGEKPTDTRKRKQTAQRAGAKKKWRKCRAPNLTNAQRGIATKAFADGKLDISFIFAERTLKEYVGLQKSPLHVNARNIFAAAIGQVMCQVNPETDRPLGGNVTAVFDILFPICQKVCHS